MKVIGKNSITNVIKLILQLLFVIGILIMIAIPILGVFAIFKPIYPQVTFLILPMIKYAYVFVAIYISGVPALIVIQQFIELFDLLKKETPFIRKTEENLNIAAKACMIIAAIYLLIAILSIYLLQITILIFSSIVMVIFLIAFVALTILAELFTQATNYKEENNLII